MIDINDLLMETTEKGASDLHITVGIRPTLRINGDLTEMEYPMLKPDDTEHLCKQVLTGRHKEIFEDTEKWIYPIHTLESAGSV